MLKESLMGRITDYLKHNTISRDLELNNGFEVSFLAQGEYNINFVIEGNGKKYVFRVNTGSQLQLDNQIRYEYEALKTLEVSGVTPKVYYVDDTKEDLEYGVLIMEFLAGKPLKYDKDLKKAAHIFAKIHSLNLNDINTNHFLVEKSLFSDRIEEAERLLHEFLCTSVVDKRLKHFFVKYLEWAKGHKKEEKFFLENPWYVINNTEVNSHNFIIGKENSYLIDWEKPVISDPCQDITQFLAETTTLWKTNHILSEAEKKFFFKNYTKCLGIMDQNIEERVALYMPYLYLRALSWCAYAWVAYHKPNKAIKNRDTFNKIKAYLDIYFMDKLLKGSGVVLK